MPNGVPRRTPPPCGGIAREGRWKHNELRNDSLCFRRSSRAMWSAGKAGRRATRAISVSLCLCGYPFEPPTRDARSFQL